MSQAKDGSSGHSCREERLSKADDMVFVWI